MKIYLPLLFALLSTLSLTAQVTPTEAADGMGRGINLGNTLEPPTEGAWNNGPAQESYFDAYVEAGFTNVRVPVRWDEHMQNTPPYAIDGAWMDRVEEVIDWGLARGLWITLNGHHEDWIKQDYSAENIARYEAMWRQIIARFGSKSDRLLYEIINEPNGLTVNQVDDLNERILAIIRETEPTRIVIFGGNMYANMEQLETAAIPGQDDQYLMGYYHSYDPWPFVGEAQGTWGTPADYRNLRNKFVAANDWRNRTGIPIHVSEFNARVEGDFNSRMRWLAEYVALLDEFDFPFSVWDDGGWFQVLERGGNVWPETKDIYVHTYADSPYRVTADVLVTTDGDPDYAIEIGWTNRATDTDSLVIERRTSPTGPFTEVARLAPDATSYLDNDVEAERTYDYRMFTTRVDDGTLVHGYPVRVSTATGTTNSGGAFNGPIAIPGVLEVEDYDVGGQDVAYNDLDTDNQGGGYRTDEGVDIGADATGFVLGYVAQGEWLDYTVEVATDGLYLVSASVASGDAASEFTITAPGGALATFNTPATGGWSDYRTITANDPVELTAGTYVLRLDITGGRAFNLDNVTFELTTGVSEAESIAAGFLVQPNPADTFVEYTLPGNVGAAGHLILTDNLGRTVRSIAAPAATGRLEVEALAPGVYFLRYDAGARSFVRRVVVQ